MGELILNQVLSSFLGNLTFNTTMEYVRNMYGICIRTYITIFLCVRYCCFAEIKSTGFLDLLFSVCNPISESENFEQFL